jgi:hypothetical protein
MTAPPGGPYGQDPYGTNPYGQDPYWGGQPQGNPAQGDPSQGGSYPYQQGGTYPQGPAGGAYPYQPTGPYATSPGGTDPNAAGGYPPQPPQQFPQAGQQYAPGWQAGSYPPGPPPGGPRSKLPWIILAAVAVLGVIALVAILALNLGDDNKSAQPRPSGSSATSATSSQANSDQTATDCTPNVSGGEKPNGGPVTAGKLSFPTNAAPGWNQFSDDSSPNLIAAVGVAKEVPGANQWVMQAEVAITNFVTSMDVAAQASKLLQCVAAGPGYANASPTLGPVKTSSTKVDGVKAARVDADITIADPSRAIKGDSVVIIAVDTKPVTIFLGATPIGDAASQATINQVISQLKVTGG